jgi:anti-sigma28 factor (negative regulator of flagellin synthesis)
VSETTNATDRRVTVEKAAELANGCHPETIRRAIRKGELKASKNRLAPGSPLVIAMSDLQAFIKARTA